MMEHQYHLVKKRKTGYEVFESWTEMEKADDNQPSVFDLMDD